MKRLIAPLVVAAVALTPGAAQAKSKVYKATFQYVGADGDYVTGSFGKAQAGTGGALSMKRFPDPLPFGCRDSWPVIDNFDDGGIILGEDTNL